MFIEVVLDRNSYIFIIHNATLEVANSIIPTHFLRILLLADL